MNPRIIPLNLPARAAEEIAGNPVTSRPETVPANCFPGLEIDHRNLDRRFFPGLIFDFVSDVGAEAKNQSVGAKLVGVDLQDLTNSQAKALTAQIQEVQTGLAGGKKIFLSALQQGSSQMIVLMRHQEPKGPLDGLIVWRLVRSLIPGELTIVLTERDESNKGSWQMVLTGPRRTFQTPEGELSSAYQPGELGQTLCSPWQHDFRDCGCTYWASNRPDIAFASHPAGISELQTDSQDADKANRNLLWLRWDQPRPVAALQTHIECRPFEMDYYELNKRWQDLPFVLEGHEMRTPYAPGSMPWAAPFDDMDELVTKLHELAAIEHALALEYLYARYSIRLNDPDLTLEQQQHADYIARELLVIATSEMMHLRWVNQLLWELREAGYTNTAIPELRVAAAVPRGRNRLRPVEMRELDVAMEDFISAEEPSGSIDGQYAKVFATFRYGHSPLLAELASRIVADGVSHFIRFRGIRAVLRLYATPAQVQAAKSGNPYLVPRLVRPMHLAKPGESDLKQVTSSYQKLYDHLKKAYAKGNAADRADIAEARKIMIELDTEGLRLGRETPHVGIPFSEIGYSIAEKYDNAPKRPNPR